MQWREAIRNRWKTIAGSIAAFVAVIWIATNVFVMAGGIEALVGSSEDVALELEGAWAPWPGRVHADQVRLRFHDYNVEVGLTVDDAEVSLALTELVSRRFHATRVRASDVRFRFRHKVKELKGDERRVAAFPPIAGFEDPPLRRGSPSPPIPDDQYDLWTIQADDVDVPVSELWIVEYRFEGEARARGRFRLKPARRLYVGPAALELASGTVAAGKSPVLEGVSGTIECTVEDFDVREPEGLAVLRHVSARVRLDAEAAHTDVSHLYARAKEPPLSGKGTLRANVVMDRGSLVQPTDVRLTANQIVARSDRLTARGPAGIRFGFGSEEQPRKAPRLELASKGLAVHVRGAPESVKPLQLSNVSGSVDLGGSDLAKPIAVASASLSVSKASIEDVRWVNALANKRLLASGRLTARLELSRDAERRLNGTAKMNLENVGVPLGDELLTLSGSVEAKETRYELEARRGTTAISAEFREVALGSSDDDERPRWWFSAHSEELSWNGPPAVNVDADFDVGGQSIEPLLPLLIDSGIVRTAATTLLDLEKTRGNVALKRTPDFFQIAIDPIQSGDVTTWGFLRSRRQGVCGAFQVRAGILNTGVLVQNGETSVSPLVGADWLDTNRAKACRT